MDMYYFIYVMRFGICYIGYYDILFLVWLYVVLKTMCSSFKYEMLIELLIGIIINNKLLLISN